MDKPQKDSPVILIVDDDDNNLFLLESILIKHGISVILALNGREAVDQCRTHPDICLVLMDLNMPVMGGLEATLIIKAFRKDLPIIAVTAFAMMGDENLALEAGCDGYLSKPMSKELLLERIQQFGVI